MVEPIVAPAAEPVAPEPETVYFNSDGTLGDGWQGTLDEGLREEKSLNGFKNVNDLAKSFVSTKSMVGKNTMEIPTDASSEIAWDAYYKAGGKPETVADYNLKAPDGFSKEEVERLFPKARMESWQERFFKAGISKKTADKFITDYAQDILADLQTMRQAEEQQESELVSGLSTDWGAAYDQKIHLGNMAIEEGTDGNAEFKARVVAKVQKDPDLTRLLANLGGKFAEGKPPNFANIPTPADYQTQIDEITANPLYMNGSTEQRMKLANQIMVLREKMAATKTT
jgi:hypothetical protein